MDPLANIKFVGCFILYMYWIRNDCGQSLKVMADDGDKCFGNGIFPSPSKKSSGWYKTTPAGSCPCCSTIRIPSLSLVMLALAAVAPLVAAAAAEAVLKLYLVVFVVVVADDAVVLLEDFDDDVMYREVAVVVVVVVVVDADVVVVKAGVAS